MKKTLICILVLFLSTCVANNQDLQDIEQEKMIEEVRKNSDKLLPLHTKLGKPRLGDWLYEHKEPGQTFAEYLECNPTLPTEKRKILYIQPLGEFTTTQRKIIQLTAEFMEAYFNLAVKTLEDLPNSVIPQHAQRIHPYWGMKQFYTRYILFELLTKRLPEDAFAIIAFTSTDLWPGMGWNFVFGEAAIKKRVGVWSTYRYGDPDESEESFRLCLLRTMQTATHETGHMFSIRHCILYDCNMCGSNSLEESDEGNIWLCPECLSKICWATKITAIKRYQKLADFCKKYDFHKEELFFQRSITALSE